jgi:hypothetical protein
MGLPLQRTRRVYPGLAEWFCGKTPTLDASSMNTSYMVAPIAAPAPSNSASATDSMTLA